MGTGKPGLSGPVLVETILQWSGVLSAAVAWPCRYIDIAPGETNAAATGGGQLQELQVVTAAHSKPQALIALLCELRDAAATPAGAGARTIVFASALDVTRRLAALLHGCRDHLQLAVHEFSSRVAAAERTAVLRTLASSSGWCAAVEALPWRCSEPCSPGDLRLWHEGCWWRLTA